MIGPMVAWLVRFLVMVWFQVEGGSQGYSREWVWNLREKIVSEGCRKVYCEYGPAAEVLCWIYRFLGTLYLTCLIGLMGSKAGFHTGGP